jgi:hypothetical protein
MMFAFFTERGASLTSLDIRYSLVAKYTLSSRSGRQRAAPIRVLAGTALRVVVVIGLVLPNG